MSVAALSVQFEVYTFVNKGVYKCIQGCLRSYTGSQASEFIESLEVSCRKNEKLFSSEGVTK